MRRIFQWGENKKEQKNENFYKKSQIYQIMSDVLRSYLEKIKSEGLKKRLSRAILNESVDSFILRQVKKHLLAKRVMRLGKGLGFVDVQYKKGGVYLEFCGFSRIILKRIVITEKQIIYAFNNIISQAEEKYIKNSDYIIEKVNDVINELSETGIYKPESSEEKTIYDLVVLILLNYYRDGEKQPQWVKSAIKNLKKGDFIEDWIETILDHIYQAVLNMSENLYFDLKVTFDSLIMRTIFNRKTNNGQISKLLLLMGIDIKKLIYSIAYDYLSPSFISGAGELLKDIAETFMFDFGRKNGRTTVDKFQKTEKFKIECLTMTFGENPDSQRSFRWFSDKKLNIFLEISTNQDFSDSKLVASKCKAVPFSCPLINLGVITKYTIKKCFQYTVNISDLKCENVYYYKLVSETGESLSSTYRFFVSDNKKDINILLLADSQGMVKSDYDVFLKVCKQGIKYFPDINFIVHMGDFVDDGNNEQYWLWTLNSRFWAENVVMPVTGNHEAKLNPAASRAGVKNAILRHFALEGLPDQVLDTGAYYSYSLGNALFIVLNTNNMDKYSKLDPVQYSWALNTAKCSDKKWKILLTHKSPYSSGPHHHEKDSEKIGKQIIELAYDANIDLVIGGHDHVYVRTPGMSWGKCTDIASKKVIKDNITYELFSNPVGTIFIVPGTSGVKNYKIDKSTTFPTEKIIDLNCPVYSKINITNDRIYFSAYRSSFLKDNLECIDAVIIEKTESLNKYISSNVVDKVIDGISDVPWAPNREKIKKAQDLFKKLDYYGKISVKNYKKLVLINRLSSSYEEIIKGEIEIVRNKKEFMDALKNKKVSTIITDCSEIKFENCFGFLNKVVVDRNLCIRGHARLLFVSFIVKDGALLILGGNVCIDNSRRVFSLYFSLNAVEVKDNSCFLMLDFSSIRNLCGIGMGGYGIYLSGESASVFLDSKSENFSRREFIFSQSIGSTIFVLDGIYFSPRKSYAICSSGNLEIKDGKVFGVKLLETSKGKMFSGTIKGSEKSKKSRAVLCLGRFEIYGGAIESGMETPIKVENWRARVYIFPDHEGAVRINKKDVFLGEIILLRSRGIKINIAKKNINKGYDNIGLYCLNKDNLYEGLSCFRVEKINVENGDIFRFVDSNHKTLSIIAKAQNATIKTIAQIRDGAKLYLISRPYRFSRGDKCESR